MGARWCTCCCKNNNAYNLGGGGGGSYGSLDGSGGKNSCMNAITRPFRVLSATFVNHWGPRLCLIMLIVFYAVLAFGLKLRINQTVYDFTEHILVRENIWHVAAITWIPMIVLYLDEWKKESKRRQATASVTADGSVYAASSGKSMNSTIIETNNMSSNLYGGDNDNIESL